MKIQVAKCLSACLLLFLFATANAQTKMEDDHENFFRGGVKGGFNINKISGRSYSDGFKYNFQGGGFLQFNFSRTFGLQPEVNFVQTQADFSDDPNDITDDLFGGGGQHKAKLNYLEVPLLLNINIGPSKRVKLQTGPAYGGLLKQTVNDVQHNEDVYKNGEWSAIGGVWFQLPFINLSARYKLGLTDINNADNGQTWKNQAIQLAVGVTF